MGVYPLQEAFRLMHLEQTPKDVNLIKAVLQSLPHNHPVNRYISNSNDLNYDAGIVDTFLNPIDQAYSVKDIFSFTRRSGLEFLNWCEPAEYSLRAQVPEDHPLWSKLTDLTREEAAHVCDLLLQSRGTHRWLAAHPDYVERFKNYFEKDSLFNLTVRLSPGVVIHRDVDLSTSQFIECTRGNLTFKLPIDLFHLLEHIDASSSIRSVLESAVFITPMTESFKLFVAKTLKDLLEMGHIQFSMPIQK
jgi:hypothetical protein